VARLLCCHVSFSLFMRPHGRIPMATIEAGYVKPLRLKMLRPAFNRGQISRLQGGVLPNGADALDTSNPSSRRGGDAGSAQGAARVPRLHDAADHMHAGGRTLPNGDRLESGTRSLRPCRPGRYCFLRSGHGAPCHLGERKTASAPDAVAPPSRTMTSSSFRRRTADRASGGIKPPPTTAGWTGPQVCQFYQGSPVAKNPPSERRCHFPA
jgi:hypothetical protein